MNKDLSRCGKRVLRPRALCFLSLKIHTCILLCPAKLKRNNKKKAEKVAVRSTPYNEAQCIARGLTDQMRDGDIPQR